MSIRTFTAQVYGVVQGVSFRYHTRRCARRLGVFGFVKNMPNGSVYLEATGSVSMLEELAQFLREGPPFASVSKVDINWQKEVKTFTSFEITF